MSKDVLMFPFNSRNESSKVIHSLLDGLVDYSESSKDDDLVNNQIVEEFKQNAKNLAIKYASEYFKGKSLYVGGKITEQILINDKIISTILNSDMLSSIDKAHGGINGNEDLVFKTSLDGVDGGAKMIIDILNDISLSPFRIPKEFAGGILLLHLELVEGVVFES
jgi:hypothetical protein